VTEWFACENADSERSEEWHVASLRTRRAGSLAAFLGGKKYSQPRRRITRARSPTRPPWRR